MLYRNDIDSLRNLYQNLHDITIAAVKASIDAEIIALDEEIELRKQVNIGLDIKI